MLMMACQILTKIRKDYFECKWLQLDRPARSICQLPNEFRFCGQYSDSIPFPAKEVVILCSVCEMVPTTRPCRDYHGSSFDEKEGFETQVLREHFNLMEPIMSDLYDLYKGAVKGFPELQLDFDRLLATDTESRLKLISKTIRTKHKEQVVLQRAMPVLPRILRVCDKRLAQAESRVLAVETSIVPIVQKYKAEI
jgi:hypothetical protein